jgi:TRAP-type C4-dicarboxylate transport system substrate-binding protein
MQPSMRPVVMSALWYNKLSPADQKRVDLAILDARAVLKTWVEQVVQKEFEMLDGIGIERIVIGAEQREEFRQRLLPMYSEIATPPAIEQMQQYLTEIRSSE